jgi:hypothetical protein
MGDMSKARLAGMKHYVLTYDNCLDPTLSSTASSLGEEPFSDSTDVFGAVILHTPVNPKSCWLNLKRFDRFAYFSLASADLLNNKI